MGAAMSDKIEKSEKSDEEWREQLDEVQFEVARKAAG